MLSSMQPGIYVYAIQSGHPACYQACHRLTTTQTNVLKTNAALYLSDLKFHFDFSFGKSDIMVLVNMQYTWPDSSFSVPGTSPT